MRKYTLTNPRFDGDVDLIYDNDGVIKIVDLTRTKMSAETANHLMKSVPGSEERIQTSFSSQTIIVSSDYQITFDMFWKKYDHKFNRSRTEKLWHSLSRVDQAEAFAGLSRYNAYLRRNTGHFKLYPDTFLRSRAWENDYR